MKEPNLNPPDDEIEDCEEVCPNCHRELNWGDTVYTRGGEIIGCEMCTGRTEAYEFFKEAQ